MKLFLQNRPSLHNTPRESEKDFTSVSVDLMKTFETAMITAVNFLAYCVRALSCRRWYCR